MYLGLRLKNNFWEDTISPTTPPYAGNHKAHVEMDPSMAWVPACLIAVAMR